MRLLKNVKYKVFLSLVVALTMTVSGNTQENSLSDRDLKSLSSSVAQLPHLISFVINYAFNQLEEDAMRVLLEKVSEKNLRNTWIGFSNNPLSD